MKLLKIALLAATALTLFGCLEGEAGAPGAAGVNGTDANESCKTCHNDGTLLKARQDQYARSTHGMGVLAVEEGSNKSCTGCHTHEGFMEVLDSNKTTLSGTIAGINNPTQQSCRTCHTIHEAYDSTDWDLRITATDSVMLVKSDSVKYNFGSGNICASCHQSRSSKTDVSAATVTMTTRYGPHYGPQSQVFKSLLGVALPGDAIALPAVGSGHAAVLEDACVSCHKTSSDGHSFVVANKTACLTCHVGSAAGKTDTIDLKVTHLEHEVDSLLTDIRVLLVQKGFVTETITNGDTTYAPKAIAVTGAQAGAVWNWRLISLDRSKGVHNPTFTRALLNNTLTYLKTLP